MGRAKKGSKVAMMKKVITSKAIKSHKEAVLNPYKKDLTQEKLPRNVPNVPSALFFKHNTALGPPYRVLVDTNFVNFSIQNKLDLKKAIMDCLYAKLPYLDSRGCSMGTSLNTSILLSSCQKQQLVELQDFDGMICSGQKQKPIISSSYAQTSYTLLLWKTL